MKTIYGDLHGNDLKAQEKLLAEIAPGQGSWEEYQAGEVYMEEGGFKTTGEMNGYTATQSNDIPKVMKKDVAVEQDPHHQGYKIHVCAHPLQAAAVAQAVLPVLRNDNVCRHKVHPVMDYARDISDEALWKAEDIKDLKSQQGKFITAYARDEEHLIKLATDIQRALLEAGITKEQHGCDPAPGDKVLSNCDDMMSVRYGVQSGGSSWQVQALNEENKPERMLGSKAVLLNGTWIQDLRDRPCPDRMRLNFNNTLDEVNQALATNKQAVQRELQERSGPNIISSSADQQPVRAVDPRRGGRIIHPADLGAKVVEPVPREFNPRRGGKVFDQASLNASLAVETQRNRQAEAVEHISRWQRDPAPPQPSVPSPVADPTHEVVHVKDQLNANAEVDPKVLQQREEKRRSLGLSSSTVAANHEQKQDHGQSQGFS